jgi:hypothetical protein
VKVEYGLDANSNGTLDASEINASLTKYVCNGASGNGFSNGTSTNQIMYWNGTSWVTLNPGNVGQVLTLCNTGLTWTVGGQCPGTITAFNCAGATNNGTLTSGTAASGVSSSIPYTGGNGGTYSAQSVSSTGVTGLTATLTAGTFANGSGTLTYTISGTPANSGTASFTLSIGGQACTLLRTVGFPVGSITALTCGSATNNGTLTSGTAANGVSSSVPYTGGNGGTYSAQSVSSTGVTGLTATLTAGTFASGSGSLTYTISGTPASSGTASFALSIGGQSCSVTINVLDYSNYIGQFFGDGIVAYIFQAGDPGYDPNVQHGIIAALNDLGSAQWGCSCVGIYTLTPIGQGSINTNSIVSQCSTSGIAAKLCYDYTTANFSDWFLPSISELNKLYTNLHLLGQGNFQNSTYWSSSGSICSAAELNFSNGTGPNYLSKNNSFRVRPVRYF